MSGRIAAAGLALAVNGLIVVAIVRLVAPEAGFRLPERERLSLDIVRYEPPPPTERERQEPREEPQPAPEPKLTEPRVDLAQALPELDLAPTDEGTANLPLRFEYAPLVAGIDVRSDVPGWGDPDALKPIVRVQPVYPPSAASRGIEGHAVVEFSLAPDGTTRDHRVVESNPPRIFDRACLRSIERQRYPTLEESGLAPDARLRRECKFEME